MAGDKRSFLSKEDLTGKISKTVFVTNFPDHITARDLWNVCTAYGKVVDVYIPLKRSKTQPSKVKINTGPVKNSFASVLKSNDHKGSPSSDSSPAIVMDDSCIVDNDLSCSLMGKIKDINALSNIYVIFADEGFDNVNISYLGGFWILIEACSVASKEKMLNHEGLASWFSELCIADPSFVSEDRLVWISIEGLPFNTWNNNAYAKIISQWGTLSEVDTTPDSSTYARKLEAWAPEFNNEFCENSSSDEESMEDGEFNSQKVDDIDHISESSCMKEGNEQQAPKTSKESEDPFGIYSILKRNNQKEKSIDAVRKSGSSFPLDSYERWLMKTIEEEENVSVNKSNSNHHCNKKTGSNGKCGSNRSFKLKAGGSILDVMEDLIEIGLILQFSSLAAICLARRLSDHRPILFHESSVDYGPTPFRVFHSWFTKDGFDNLIADTWNNLSIMETNKISLLRKKFQALKAIIKNWSRDEMLKASAVRHSAQSRISELDKLIDKGLSNNDIINERISLLKDIHDLDKRHSSDLAQKAKIQWAIEGDENSKYFHGIINKKRSQLAIRGVLVDGEWIEDPPKVKNEFLEHFSNRFSMPTGQTINLDSHMFQKISIDQNADLESDVSLEEIKKAVWECGTNKSPGPDGFSFEFIRKYWNIIQHDVVNAVKEFFSSSKFPPGSNSSFITLIPKSLDAKMVKDFRPISLIGSFYKIVAKILSNRLCIVMPDLISDVQTAFISKRQILDGPFILNELISWCKYHKIKAMIFKADFEKAFDSVRWDYLDGVLNNFGFGVKWRGWIQACLSSAMGSILVNGSPSSEFKFHKGLKQGDPLSPFLFILVMESLHISFNNILNSGLYKGIRIDESLTLSHLFYADDAVFIGKWDKANVITIVNMLKCFYLASGLKINIQKSKIMGIGTSQEEVDVAANVIGCNTFSSPFNYLGVKVGSSSSRSNFWDEVIAKLSSCLSKWKIKMLSIGGRFTLNKDVLSSLPIYLMSIYKTPVGVLRKMESIRRRFFNGADINENKMSMIGWEKIMVSRKKGGLGISSFFAQNRALLFKWIWRFRSKDSSLWYRVIKAMFGDDGALDNTVGNGLNTLFWVDSWLTDIPLKQLYPRMFALDCNKNSTVAEKINASSISCSFRRLPRESLEEEQFSKLIEDVNSVIPSVSNDRWIWSLDSSGEYSIKSTRLFIDDNLLLAVGAPTRWVSEVPIKINIMAWKVSLDKLPTRLNLSLRGIEIPSITCPICSCAGESCSHLFFSCSMARNITTKLARWWEFDCPDLFSYDDWLEWFHTLRLFKGFKDILEGVFYVMWWVIWKYRNQTLFGSSQPRMDMLFDEIVFLSFTWCSNRCKNNFDWISWMKCPRSLSL
ncbi:RNA-directed DNA polymerase, eukaryota [Tanacetum coccineum]